MEKEFVPYELASRMKQLGFDEPCFAWYDGRYTSSINKDYCKNSEEWLNTIHCAAPLFQQALRWFREKYKIHHRVDIQDLSENLYDYEILEVLDGFNDTYTGSSFKSYEEAQTACLEKIIKIAEKK